MDTWITASPAYRDLLDAHWYTKYQWAFYWAVTTMISVGYGDIVPYNVYENAFTIITMFISCIMFAYNINSVWSII